MIKKALISLIVGLMTISVYAQKEFGIKETNYEFLNSDRPTLTLTIPLTNYKTVEKEWTQYIKKFKHEKFKTKKEVMIADNVTILSVSNNPFDIYAAIEEKEDAVDFYVAADLGNAYLTSNDGKSYDAFKATIRTFALNIVKDVYDERLEEQNDIIEELTKNVEKAQEDKQNRETENEEYKKAIEENEQAIVDLSSAIEKDSATLEEEKMKLEQMKAKAAEYF